MPPLVQRQVRGFTLVELLVALVVLSVLVTLITVVASRALDQQKRSITDQTMRTTLLAIEQFATENPLRTTYDRKDFATFGPFPAYQLAGDPVYTSGNARGADICALLEPDLSRGSFTQTSWNHPESMIERLNRDLGNRSPESNQSDWVQFDTPLDQGDGDILGLYAALRIYSPAAAQQLPASALRPMRKGENNYVSTNGKAADANDPNGRVDVLGLHDGWGVPLDYFVYVKLEWGLRADETAGFRVVDRRPVLRSRGVSREEYDVWRKAASDAGFDFDNVPTELKRKDRWIFSEPLPQPWAGVDEDGKMTATSGQETRASGWVRAVGVAEDYKYRPDQD